MGYDGKGQGTANDRDQAIRFLRVPAEEGWIAEKRISLEAEVSILVARNPKGEIATFPLLANEHVNHILDVTQCPVPNALRRIETQAVEIAQGVAKMLDLCGLLCIEFFLDDGGNLMINELAPRPHNSGHLTMDACVISQFEQQLRAVCGLPLGCTHLRQPAAMANLLGDLWENGTPNFSSILQDPNLFLHLYGKEQAKVGRKMGHINSVDSSPSLASERVRAARERMRTLEKG